MKTLPLNSFAGSSRRTWTAAVIGNGACASLTRLHWSLSLASVFCNREYHVYQTITSVLQMRPIWLECFQIISLEHKLHGINSK